MSAAWTHAATLADVRAAQLLPLTLGGRTLVLVADGEAVRCVDNRCPHMGFPMHRGSAQDGILTCHWHHARFDLCTGGTLDLWADDLPAFPVEVRGEEVWVDLAAQRDPLPALRRRLQVGLQQNLSLVVAKSVLGLAEAGADPRDAYAVTADYGLRYRGAGFGSGLVIATAMVNLLPGLACDERPRALYHGLSAVAADTAGQVTRQAIDPLPRGDTELASLKRWFRRCIEVRDRDGAERCLVTAVRAGAPQPVVEDFLWAAATDHRYLDLGHTLDFTNKACELVGLLGWDRAEAAVASLVPLYTNARRQEESSAWRQPVDLVELLRQTFAALPARLDAGARHVFTPPDDFTEQLLGEDPHALLDALNQAVASGATVVELAAEVSYAAALRLLRFPLSNEFGDWDTALHTYTYANAIELAARRQPPGFTTDDPVPALLRAVYDAALSVYLDRFLNVPAVRLPEGVGDPDPDALAATLTELLDRQQQADHAAAAVAGYLAAGGEHGPLVACLGRLLLREDRNFHTIQALEASVTQAQLRAGSPRADHVLLAATRYLAAHAPTMRTQGQTYEIARRLQRGEHVFA